jgi:hypothetical protein
MQDKYVGDIGDYGKLTLLRQLVKSGLSLGVVWCAADGKDEKNNDGSLRKYRSYTGKDCLKHCDPELFEQLGRFEDHTQRKIENLHPLLPNSVFFNESLSNTPRNEWLGKALEATSRSELIFFDPDNGIGPRSSQKHISIEELEAYWERGQSLLVYHHLSHRKGGHKLEVEDIGADLKSVLIDCEVVPIHLRRGNARVFYLAVQPSHRTILLPLLKPEPWKALTLSKREWAQDRSLIFCK